MRIFIICPVRNASAEQKDKITSYMDNQIANGHSVYYPAIHTDQSGDGVNICKQNKSAIVEADEVHVFYDPNSAGTLFDLGMAYALNKPLVLINTVELTEHKSFNNVIRQWANETLIKHMQH